MKATNNCVKIKFEVKPYNIDAAGHVNNAVYINWLEDLRTKLFRKILPLDKLNSKGFHLVVASTEIHYKHPIYLTDKPAGEIRIDNLGKGNWYLSATIESNQKRAATAVQKCVFINKETNKMVKDFSL